MKPSSDHRLASLLSIAALGLLLAACGGGGSSGGGTASYSVTATAGSNGAISPGSATVSEGDTTSFTVTPDSGYGIDTVTGCGGGLSGNTYTTGAVTADCTVSASFAALPSVTISEASVVEGDSGTTSLTFTVSLSAQANGNVNVDYATSDGSATTADSDYAAASGTLTINSGTTSNTISVAVNGDTAPEANETLSLSLSNVSANATLGTPATATGTLLNDDAALPGVTIADASILEGDSGTTAFSFTVSLSAQANGDVTVDYATSDGSATTADSDYVAASGTLTINSGTTSNTISVTVNGDTTPEANETLSLTLSNVSANATLGTPATATGTLLNDDAAGTLNDTGITTCSDVDTNGLTCPQSGFGAQDAEYGRDATANDDSDGHAGFSFTKLDSSGSALPASASSWSCVQDNVTGLIWEVKTADGGLRDRTWTYTWYSSDSATNGGAVGFANGGTCYGSTNCDTEKYVADVNSAGLCGAADWRLPNKEELSSLVDSSVAYPSPTIDTGWFPKTAAAKQWSSSPYAYFSSRAWYVDFYYGFVFYNYKDSAFCVRLVRGGQ